MRGTVARVKLGWPMARMWAQQLGQTAHVGLSDTHCQREQAASVWHRRFRHRATLLQKQLSSYPLMAQVRFPHVHPEANIRVPAHAWRKELPTQPAASDYWALFLVTLVVDRLDHVAKSRQPLFKVAAFAYLQTCLAVLLHCATVHWLLTRGSCGVWFSKAHQFQRTQLLLW